MNLILTIVLSRKNIPVIFLLISLNVFGQEKGKKVPFRLINNHIYIQGMLNDSFPVSILLDCGAPTIISVEQVKKAKLKTHSDGHTEGVGNDMVPYQMTDMASFNLGSVRYTEKTIPVLSFKEVERCGAEVRVDKEGRLTFFETLIKKIQPIDAVLGDEFFQRFIIKIDYQKQVLTLYEPATFKYAGKGDRIPLQYTDNHIYVRATMTGPDSLFVSGNFMVDCGSMTGVVLNVPFIKQNELTPPAGATEISICGIGGSSKSMMGTLADIQIGKTRIKKPITIFSQASGGVLTRPDVAGSIGNGILRKFDVIFDYSRREMILE